MSLQPRATKLKRNSNLIIETDRLSQTLAESKCVQALHEEQNPSPIYAKSSSNIKTAPSLILPGLWLGSERDAHDISFIKENNISFVLNVSKEAKNAFENDDDIEYCHFDFQDYFDQDILNYLPKCFEFLAKSRSRNALIHCTLGISRSPTIAIAYVMKVKGWRMQKSYDHVKQIRNSICPNVGFMSQLSQYEKTLFSLDDQKDDILNDLINSYSEQSVGNVFKSKILVLCDENSRLHENVQNANKELGSIFDVVKMSAVKPLQTCSGNS
ncbi:phosphatases II, partial [Rozella allomycis CSF55]